MEFDQWTLLRSRDYMEKELLLLMNVFLACLRQFSPRRTVDTSMKWNETINLWRWTRMGQRVCNIGSEMSCMSLLNGPLNWGTHYVFKASQFSMISTLSSRWRITSKYVWRRTTWHWRDARERHDFCEERVRQEHSYTNPLQDVSLLRPSQFSTSFNC